jgi:hypothetical protein
MKRKPYEANTPIQKVAAKDPSPIVNNRALDTKVPDTMGEGISVKLELVDETIIQYLSDRINPIITQDGTQVKIPVVYGNPERWKSIQKDGVIRDKFNKIQLPIIMIRRTGMEKGGMHSPVNKHLVSNFETGWNRRNPYDKFNVLNGIVPSKEYFTTVRPDYYDFFYELYIWTELMEQMNSVIEQISFEFDEFWGDKNGFKFRVMADKFDTTIQTPEDSERIVRTTMNLKALGYVLPEKMLDKNNLPSMIQRARYTNKKIVVFTEVVDRLDEKN